MARSSENLVSEKFRSIFKFILAKGDEIPVWKNTYISKTYFQYVLLILKGQLHGRAEFFEGLKMTFKTKILKKKNYTTLISVKNTTNFVLTTFLYDDFFLTAHALDGGQAC